MCSAHVFALQMAGGGGWPAAVHVRFITLAGIVGVNACLVIKLIIARAGNTTQRCSAGACIIFFARCKGQAGHYGKCSENFCCFHVTHFSQ